MPIWRRRRGGRRPRNLTGTELAALGVHSLAGAALGAASWACGEPPVGLAIMALVGGPALVRSFL
ncbi:MAG: hypothetical protein JOZ41_17645 [Chloroflexi bacterium]|nr:hypothetical protein [Chloroflexota bacterium]